MFGGRSSSCCARAADTRVRQNIMTSLRTARRRAERSPWPRGVRHRGSASLVQAFMLNCGNLRSRCKGKGTSSKREADSTDARPRAGATRSSYEATAMVARYRVMRPRQLRKQEERGLMTKSFEIIR
jgi:hypothetical protein